MSAGKERRPSAAAKVDAVAARMGLGRCSPKTKPRPSESCLTPETNELHELRSLLDQEKQVAQAFRFFLKRYDSNGDGLLSTAEFANVLRLQHRHRESAMTEAQVAAAVALVDRNKDGTIDEGEFISWALNCDVRGISNSEPSRVMALLRSPAMVYIPPKEQRDNLGKLQKPVLDRRSPAVQAHYGLTIEDIFEGGPDRVLRKLRLTEVVNYRGGHGGFLTLMKFDKMKPGGSAELLHAATGLGVYFIISMVLDTGRDDDGGGGGGGLETKESARHDSKHFFTARDYSKKLSGAFQDGVGGLFWLFKKVIIPTTTEVFADVRNWAHRRLSGIAHDLEQKFTALRRRHGEDIDGIKGICCPSGGGLGQHMLPDPVDAVFKARHHQDRTRVSVVELKDAKGFGNGKFGIRTGSGTGSGPRTGSGPGFTSGDFGTTVVHSVVWCAELRPDLYTMPTKAVETRVTLVDGDRGHVVHLEAQGLSFYNPASGKTNRETKKSMVDQGTLFPPPHLWGMEPGKTLVTDEYLVYYVAAIARACDSEFQGRVARACARLKESGCPFLGGSGDGACAAPPKNPGRMLNKWKTDHQRLGRPRPGQNSDIDRCCITTEPKWLRTVFDSVSEAISEHGGSIVRVKNALTDSDYDPRAQYGYRCVLANYRMCCQSVTYSDVAVELEKIMAKGNIHSHNGHKGSSESLQGQLEFLRQPEVASQAVVLMVEVQYLLKIHLEGRKSSHWPYKFVRCDHENTSQQARHFLEDSKNPAHMSQLMPHQGESGMWTSLRHVMNSPFFQKKLGRGSANRTEEGLRRRGGEEVDAAMDELQEDTGSSLFENEGSPLFDDGKPGASVTER